MTERHRRELHATIREIFEQKIPFCQLLGLEVESLDGERAVIGLPMRPELVGNYIRGSLHGGVTSAILDTAGGLLAFASLLGKLQEEPMAERTARLANVGTVDLRVDYLRAGVGSHFRAEAWPLRTGNKLTVARMELRNEEGTLLAVGTGTYLIG